MLQEGDVLAEKYRIVRLLGEGGMGAVYEAQHELIGKRVAIKTLRPHLVQSSDAVHRFTREAKSAGAIGHPSIIDIYDIGEAPDGTLFLVMEYLEGCSLGDMLKRDPILPPSFTAYVVCQVLSALDAAHEKSIIHRDIKPDNIFLVDKGRLLPEIKLLDFGISKIIDHHDPSFSMTGTGEVVGTPFYLSPEQARGSDDLDHRIDIYSSGVVLYECLTGSRPFVAKNFLALITDLVTSQPPMPRTLSPDLSPELEEVILRAMQKEREKRYESARHMLDALLPFVDENARGYLTLSKDSGILPVVSGNAPTETPSSWASMGLGRSDTLDPATRSQTGKRSTEVSQDDAARFGTNTIDSTSQGPEASRGPEVSSEDEAAFGLGTNMAWQSKTEPSPANTRRLALVLGLLLVGFVVFSGVAAAIWFVVAGRISDNELTPPSRPPITVTSPNPRENPEESNNSGATGSEINTPAQRESQEIVVSLEGVPEGAQVYLDGALVEERELRVPRSSGAHEVRVVQDGRVLWRQQVNFKNDEAVAVGLPLTLGAPDAGETESDQERQDGGDTPPPNVIPRRGSVRNTGRGTSRGTQPAGPRSRFNRDFN